MAKKPTGTVDTPYSDKTWDVFMAKDTVAVSGDKPGNRWVQIESITPAVIAAEKLVEWFVEDVLGEAVNFPLTVNIRPFGKKSLTKYGHFTIEPNWSTREGNPVWEICLVAEHLSKDPRQTATTILHEAVHVYNFVRGEKDAAKSGRHNGTFAEAAETAGLIVQKDDKHGYVTTGISDELWEKIEQHCPVSVETFNLFYNAYEPKEPKPSKTKVYQCGCEFKVRVPSKQEMDADCNICGQHFELVTS